MYQTSCGQVDNTTFFIDKDTRQTQAPQKLAALIPAQKGELRGRMLCLYRLQAGAAKDGPLEAFLDLVRKEKFREAADEFAKLVKDLKCSKLTAEKEQEFRLHPTKAFKRVRAALSAAPLVASLCAVCT